MPEAPHDPRERSDAELVVLALREPQGYRHLMERYEPKLLRYIRRISGVVEEDAEDILQEVFIKVYQNLNDFDRALSFSSWIYRIAHNETVSHWRGRQARPPEVYVTDDDRELVELLRADVDLPATLDRSYTAEAVRGVLEHLDSKYREALVLRFLEEKSYQEMSDILRKPLGTIATLLNRAKQRFNDEVVRRNLKF